MSKTNKNRKSSSQQEEQRFLPRKTSSQQEEQRKALHDLALRAGNKNKPFRKVWVEPCDDWFSDSPISTKELIVRFDSADSMICGDKWQIQDSDIS